MADPRWRLDERHDLLAECPAGAAGTVWLVRDRQSGTEYAVKILRPELTAASDSVAELRVLLDTVERLGHPGVLAVDEVVTHEDRLVLVTKRVNGEDLGTLLARQGALAPRTAALLAAQLCDALAAAHAAGIAHGDVKPSNVLLEADPRTGTPSVVRLTDFGMAGLLARAAAGQPPDSPLPEEYQAPEIGVGEPPTAASDMYAVGILLYEALAGARPFADRPAHGAERLRGQAQPPRIPGLPDPLWLLVTACLDEHPRHRPGAADLASLLREVAPSADTAPAVTHHGTPAADPAPFPSTRMPTLPPTWTGTGQATLPKPGRPAADSAFAPPRRSLLGRRRKELAVLIVSMTLGVILALILESHGSRAVNQAGPPVGLASAVTGAADGLGATGIGIATLTSTATGSATATLTSTASTGTPVSSTSTMQGNPSATGVASTTGAAVTVTWKCLRQSASDNIDMKACIGIGSDHLLYMRGAFYDTAGENLSGVKLILVSGNRALLSTSTLCGNTACSDSAGPYNPAPGTYQVVAVVNNSSDQVASPSQPYPAG
jgi:serine/threonine protein kinase, bacterial